MKNCCLLHFYSAVVPKTKRHYLASETKDLQVIGYYQYVESEIIPDESKTVTTHFCLQILALVKNV